MRHAERDGRFSAAPAPRITATLGDPTKEYADALRQLFSIKLREAQTMAYGDAFVVIAVCFAIATVMVPLMRKVAPPKAPSADGH